MLENKLFKSCKFAICVTEKKKSMYIKRYTNAQPDKVFVFFSHFHPSVRICDSNSTTEHLNVLDINR